MNEKGQWIFFGLLAVAALIIVPLVLMRRMQVAPAPAPPATYDNDEVWSITYNEDGLPVEVKVSRHAVQAQIVQTQMKYVVVK